MVHKIKVGDKHRAFELSLYNILEADQRFGIKVYDDDFIPPISMSAMAKFAVIGFQSEKPDIGKAEAIQWLQKSKSDEIAAAVVDGFKRLNNIEDDGEDTSPLSEGGKPSTSTKSDSSDSES